MIGDDLAGLDDVFEEVAHGVAIGGTRDVGSNASAVAIESMAGQAHHAAEHGLTIGEVALLKTVGRECENLIDGPGFAGSLGGDEVGDVATFDFAGELVHFSALAFGNEIGEGFGADVLDEAFEAVATLPGAGAGEPGKERLPEFGRPAFRGVSERKHEGDLLAIGTAGGGGLSGAGVSLVTGKHGI